MIVHFALSTMPEHTDDEYARISDDEVVAEIDKLIAEVEAGEIEASPKDLADLRQKREDFLRAIHNEKIALRNLAITKAATQTASARLLKLFDAQTNPNNETGH